MNRRKMKFQVNIIEKNVSFKTIKEVMDVLNNGNGNGIRTHALPLDQLGHLGLNILYNYIYISRTQSLQSFKLNPNEDETNTITRT
jgi:hypothetical protein